LGFSRCELLLLEAGCLSREQFKNPEDGESPVVGSSYQTTAVTT
jgi:hypothetical protein